MSVESIAIALHHSRATGTAKLVLIGIANHDGDGGAWPSVSTLARYANVTPRNVQKALDKLEQLHEVRRMIQAGGTQETANHERPNRYLFTLQCPPDCDRSTHHRTRRQPAPMLDIDPLSETTPPVGNDTRPPVGNDTLTIPVTTTHLSETKPSDRARASKPVWADSRCPGNWKTETHELGHHGKCLHCSEKPTNRNGDTA